MERTVKSTEEKYLLPALELAETVFADSESAESGKLVRSLVEEIRAKRFYVPGGLDGMRGQVSYYDYKCLV